MTCLLKREPRHWHSPLSIPSLWMPIWHWRRERAPGKNSTSYFIKLHTDRGASSAMYIHFKRFQQKVGERSHPPLCCSPSWGLATETALSCPSCTHQGAAVPGSRAAQPYAVWASHRHMWESLELPFQEPSKFGTLLIMQLHCIYRLMSPSHPRDQIKEVLVTLKHFSLHKIWIQSKLEDCDVTGGCDVSRQRITMGTIWVYPGQQVVTINHFSFQFHCCSKSIQATPKLLKDLLDFLKYAFSMVSFNRFNVILSHHIW